jgi:hypothetical protein
MKRWLWAQGSERFSKAGTQGLLDIASRCHFTDIIFLAHHSSHGALWDSQMFNPATLRVDNLPYLDYLVGEASLYNIRVHAWLAVGSWPWMWGMLQSGTPNWKWAQATWLDMTIPAAQTAVGDAAADLESNVAGLAGVHLDYIRRKDAVANPTIQAQHVTACVFQARQKTSLELTAAVVPHTYPGFDIAECAQDWPAWLDNGLVDECMPMLYYGASWVGTQLGHIETESQTVLDNVTVGVSPADYRGNYRSVTGWEAILDLCIGKGYDMAVFDDNLVDSNYQPALEARPLSTGTGGLITDLNTVAADLRAQAALLDQMANSLVSLDQQAEQLAADALQQAQDARDLADEV